MHDILPDTDPMGVQAYFLSKETVIAYMVPVIGVVFFDLDLRIFVLCLTLEIFIFLVARIVQLHLMPGGVLSLVGTILIMPLVLVSFVAFFFAWNVTVSGAASTLFAIAAFGALLELSTAAVKRFRLTTLKQVKFRYYINHKYKIAATPGKPVFSNGNAFISTLITAYLGGIIYALYTFLAVITWLINGGGSESFDSANTVVIILTLMKFGWELLTDKIYRAIASNQGVNEEEFVNAWSRIGYPIVPRV